MERKTIVPELIVIRAVACLTVVLLHAIGMVIADPEASRGLNTTRLLLLFATPTFAYMSAFLIGFSKTKRTFWQTIWQRVKFLLLPYLCFAVFYAAWQNYQWGAPLGARIWYNVRGGYHGYFVLVVMQFYLFHPLFKGLLDRFSPWVTLPIAGMANIVYLAALNFNLISLPDWGFNWYHFFPAWAFYYVLGYYSGRDRDRFQLLLRRYWPFAAALMAGGAALVLKVTYSGLLPDVTSQRFDVLIYAAGVIMVAFLLAGRMQRIPAVLNQINRASFGIYLLHWFFLELFRRVLFQNTSMPAIAAILVLFVTATVASTLVIFGLNHWKIGTFVVGRLGVDARTGQLKPVIDGLQTAAPKAAAPAAGAFLVTEPAGAETEPLADGT